MKYSKFILLLFFLFSIFFLNSCSRAGGNLSTNSLANNASNNTQLNAPQKLTTVRLKLPDGEQLAISAVLNYGKWTPSPLKDYKDVEYYAQSYCLSNGTETKDSSPKDEFLQICFIINDNKRWENRTPVAPNNYYLSTAGFPEMGRIASVRVSAMKDKRQFRDIFIDKFNTVGNLIIEKSSAQFISGKFALSGTAVSINGDFGLNIYMVNL